MKNLSDSIVESLNQNINEEQEINESFIADLVSGLSRDEMGFLIGIVGGAGMLITAATYSKVVDAVKKKGGPLAKKIVAKLEEVGSTAGKTTQQK